MTAFVIYCSYVSLSVWIFFTCTTNRSCPIRCTHATVRVITSSPVVAAGIADHQWNKKWRNCFIPIYAARLLTASYLYLPIPSFLPTICPKKMNGTKANKIWLSCNCWHRAPENYVDNLCENCYWKLVDCLVRFIIVGIRQTRLFARKSSRLLLHGRTVLMSCSKIESKSGPKTVPWWKCVVIGKNEAICTSTTTPCDLSLRKYVFVVYDVWIKCTSGPDCWKGSKR